MILFRAWMKKEFSLPKASYDEFTLEEILSSKNDFSKYENWCRFTGFFDKNGKRIYEGDVLVYRKVLDTTVYRDTKTNFIVKKPKKNPKEELHYWTVYFDEKKGSWKAQRGETGSNLFEKSTNHEIIGNIYENPLYE